MCEDEAEGNIGVGCGGQDWVESEIGVGGGNYDDGGVQVKVKVRLSKIQGGGWGEGGCESAGPSEGKVEAEGDSDGHGEAEGGIGMQAYAHPSLKRMAMHACV